MTEDERIEKMLDSLRRHFVDGIVDLCKTNEPLARLSLQDIFDDGWGATNHMTSGDIEYDYHTTFDVIDDPYHPELKDAINTAPVQFQDNSQK